MGRRGARKLLRQITLIRIEIYVKYCTKYQLHALGRWFWVSTPAKSANLNGAITVSYLAFLYFGWLYLCLILNDSMTNKCDLFVEPLLRASYVIKLSYITLRYLNIVRVICSIMLIFVKVFINVSQSKMS